MVKMNFDQFEEEEIPIEPPSDSESDSSYTERWVIGYWLGQSESRAEFNFDQLEYDK